MKPNLTVYDKLLCKNKGPLTASDDQLPVGGKWENVEFSFLPISIKPFLFPIPIPMKLAYRFPFLWVSH